MATSPLPLGIDVSDYQGRIDWQQVKNSGVAFAIIKATEGTYHVQRNFEYNWKSCLDVGLYRGAYHFARPSEASAVDESYHFYETVIEKGGPLIVGDMLAMDMEDTNFHGDADPWGIYFLQLMKMLTGYDSIYYTGKWYIDSRYIDSPLIANNPLWLGNYRETMPPAPEPWDAISIWQYSEHGRVPGIEGNVDMNRFNGAANRIPLLGKPPEGSIPPTQPPITSNKKQAILDSITYLEERNITLKEVYDDVDTELKKLKKLAESL